MQQPRRAASRPADGAAPPRWSVLLRSLRESSGVTQDGWAARLGYSRATVQRWERGQTPPDAAAEEALVALCAERRLYRTFDGGLLAGLTLTPGFLRDLLAEARGGAGPAPSLPPSVARLFDRARSRLAAVPGEAASAAVAPSTPIPAAPATSFIGREEEMEEVNRLLETGRLVTLTGPGGIGKTRLALHAAETAAARWGVDVVLVELAPLADPALVPAAVAAAVGVREESGRSLTETLAAALTGRESLLILDNCEHLLRATAELAEPLLRACPTLRILATSRVALASPRETVWRVPPMALSVVGDRGAGIGSVLALDHRPATTDQRPPDAVRLFAERATAALPTFRLSGENAAVVTHICRRLDGIPLAIELAAARVRILAPEQIAARLDERLRLLGGGDPAEPRHETLRAALDWSHDLLSEPERVLLRRLAVFVGGCDIDAVEAVCTGDGVSSDGIFDLVTHLTDKSLLVVEHARGVARYRLLETVRQYAAERLNSAGEAAAVRARLCGWSLALAGTAAPRLTGAEQAAWLERLEAEHDNLRAALRWTLEEGHAATGLSLAAALWRFWQMRGYLTEGRGWLDRFLEQGRSAPAAERAAALLGAGSLAHDQGDYLGAVPRIEQALTLAREAGREATAADALMLLGVLAWRRSDYDAAVAHCEESLAIARVADDRRLASRCLNLLGLIALDRGHYPLAHERFDEALVVARGIGDLRTSAVLLSNLGLTEHRLERFDRAQSYLDEALAINRRLSNRTEIGRNLITLAVVALGAGDPERALERAREALAAAEEIGNRNGITEALNQLTLISRQRGDLAAAREYSLVHLRTAREMQYPMQMLGAVWEAAANARAGANADRAVRLIAASEAYREAAGIAQSPAMRATVEEHIAALRASLGEPAFAAAWAAGAAMSLDQAIEHALTGDGIE